jgi:methyl-accepting chemotaxis protein
MTQSQRKFAGANQSLGQPEAAKGEIDTQNGKLSKIIKAMDEIAFEAKILAVNSALLAARAGESGIGFGVVVDEMRNLSRRCAQAANDASALIEKPVARSYDGRATVGQAAAGLRTKTAESTEVITRVDEASLGNEVQNHGGEQMEPVAQQTAANAAERSAAAGALIAQWETLIDIVENSTTAVSGGESAWDGARHSARDRGGLVAQSAGASGKSSTHAKAFLPAGASSAANAFPPEDEFKELRN